MVQFVLVLRNGFLWGEIEFSAPSQNEANYICEQLFLLRVRQPHMLITGMAYEWLVEGEKPKKIDVMVPESIYARVKEGHYRLHGLER